MFDAEVDTDLTYDCEAYGDELEIRMCELTGGRMQQTVHLKDLFLCLHTKENKIKILKEVLPLCKMQFLCNEKRIQKMHADMKKVRISR